MNTKNKKKRDKKTPNIISFKYQIPAIAMTKKFTAADVLALLEADDEFDDPDEVFVEGSDEEFDDVEELEELEELQNGNDVECERMEVGNGNFQCKYYIFINIILNNIIIDLQTSSEIWETDPDMAQNLSSPVPATNTVPSTTSTNGIMDESGPLNISIPIPSSHYLHNVASSPSTPWTKHLKKPHNHKFSPLAPIGPTVPIPDSPFEIFQHFYTSELLDNIVVETNKYARQVMSSEKFSKFEPISKTDIEAFMGFNILMGINSLPSIEMYWQRETLHHYAPIADRISRDRYKEISRYLHFADNTTLSPPGTPSYDRLGKVRTLLNYLLSKFSAIYNPGENVSVDEAMIKFQGRSSLKQYMPMKPIKRGIKVWTLADKNGFFCRVQVYTGKKKDVEHSLGNRVVKDLTEDLQGCWRHVFFDSFFTSRQLLCDLESKGIYGCGTARKDRKGFPADLKNIKMKSR